jgi:hypothetical protein
MSMKDIYSYLAFVGGLVPQTITTGGGAKNTGDVDLQGCNAVTIAMPVGVSGDTLSTALHHVVTLTHADDNGSGSAGTYSAVAAKDVLGVTPDANGKIFDFDGTINAASTCPQVGYVGNKRFIKITTTPTGTVTNGMPQAIVIVKGERSVSP